MTHENPFRGSRRPLASDHQDGSNGRGRFATPAVVVVFELEATPKVIAAWSTDSDDARITAWLDSHPEYAELLHRAVELSEIAA
jgi:hypothetical protein